jgi:hypothetical protein
MNTLYITLARCDGKSDNRILSVLDVVKKHAFEFDTPSYLGGFVACVRMDYRYIGKLALVAALDSLASALGQNNAMMDGSEFAMCEELAA